MTTTIFTDNFTGTNGADWSSSYWSTKGSNTTTSNANATINASNQGKMTTGNGDYSIWERSNQADSLLTDFLVTLTKDTNARPYYAVVGINSTAAPTFSASSSSNSNLTPTNGAWVEIQGDAANTSGAVKLNYRSNSGSITTTTVPFSWANGVTNKIRVVQTATQIKVTCWTGTEPGTPTLTVTPTTMPLAGKPWLAVGNPHGQAGMGATTGVLFDDATYVTNDVTVVNVNPSTTPATVTTLMVDPAHIAGTGVSYTAAVGTATALATTPTITHIQNPNYSASPATASATMVDPTEVETSNYATTFGTDTIGGQPVNFATYFGAHALVVAGLAGSYSNQVLTHDTSINGGLSEIPMLENKNFDIIVTGRNNAGVMLNGVSSGVYTTVTVDLSSQQLKVTRSGSTLSSASFSVSSNARWNLRVHKTGTSLDATVWLDGTAEPGTVTLSITDTSGTYAGVVASDSSGIIEYVGLSTDGLAEIYHIDKEIVAGVLTASAEEENVVINTGTGESATAISADATSVDPTVQTTATVTIVAGIMSADETMPGGVAFTPDVHNFPAAFEASVEFVEPVVTAGTDISIDAATNTADADMTDATFSNMTNINVYADAINASAKLMYYSESEDPWINIITQALNTEPADPYLGHWYKLNTASGTTVVDSSPTRASAIYDATWVGTPGLRAGVDEFNRYYTHFDGATYLRLYQQDDAFLTGRTSEIVFRTSASGTMTLFAGRELLETSGGIDTHNIDSGAYLANGQLYLFSEMWAAQPIPRSAGLNDNRWHHLVVTDDTSFTEVHLDGKSVFIRYGEGGFVIPEIVGASYNGTNAFIGDIVAFINYESSTISRDFGALHYYAYEQATLVAPTPATAAAEMENAKGRGNQLRALGLYWRPDRPDLQEDSIMWSGIDMTTHGVFGAGLDTAPFTMGPYIVFPKSVSQDEWNVAPDIYKNVYDSGYINDYDGSPRYINLETDIPDISDYDMVFFIDTPPYHYTTVWSSGAVNNIRKDMSVEYERLLATVRWAVDQGLSMWIPQPEVAYNMGICSPKYDSADRESLYDYQAFINDFRPRSANEYLDFNFNNKLRIVARIDGLTNHPGYLRDTIGFWENPAFSRGLSSGDVGEYGGGGLVGQALQYEFYNVRDRLDGLQIGDEIDVMRMQEELVINNYWHGPMETLASREVGQPEYSNDVRYARSPNVVYGIDPTKPIVGTVIAEGRSQYYTTSSLRTGASANTVMAVVVEPGTMLNGTETGGKIFVYFNESDIGGQTYFRELNKNLGLTPPFSVHDVSPYDWDSRRYLARISIFNAVQYGVFFSKGNGEGITLKTQTELRYPAEELAATAGSEIESLWTPNMVFRGMLWMGFAESEVAEGDVLFRTQAAVASAEMEDGQHVTIRNVTVASPSAKASANIMPPAEATVRDVTVVGFSMDASATMVGLAETIRPAPMTASADMVWNNKMITTTGEDISFTLSNNILEFYVLEE